VSDWRLDRLEERYGAVRFRCERGRSITEVRAQFADDPVGFAEQVCGAQLIPYQRDWLLAMRDERQVAIATGHAMGKDFTSALFALWFAFVKGGRVLVTSATQRQVAEQFFGEVARHFNRSQLPGVCLQTMLRVPGAPLADGLPPSIIGFTSESASTYSGFHGAHVAVVMSEAQGIVGADAWVGLMSCGVGTWYSAIRCSTPANSSTVSSDRAGAHSR
jgi:hypothetical protein